MGFVDDTDVLMRGAVLDTRCAVLDLGIDMCACLTRPPVWFPQVRHLVCAASSVQVIVCLQGCRQFCGLGGTAVMLSPSVALLTSVIPKMQPLARTIIGWCVAAVGACGAMTMAGQQPNLCSALRWSLCNGHLQAVASAHDNGEKW